MGSAKDIKATLSERSSRYGDFTDHARVTMALCDVVRFDPASKYNEMPAHHRLAIDVILNKIARACTGDPNYDDNWHDIIGYAKLVEDRIIAANTEPTQSSPPPRAKGRRS